MSIPSWMLCGEDGPSGGFALVTAHVKGIYYAMQGDGAKAAGAAGGLWGSLSGGVIGFCLGGPVGAFFGSLAGGTAAGLATEGIINAFSPKHPDSEKHVVEKHPFGINKKYLHRFRRRPAVRESIDHMYFKIKEIDGDKYMFWMYEGREIPVFAKPDDPNHLYVYHYCGRNQCESSWQLTPEGNLKERNITLNETWNWIREN